MASPTRDEHRAATARQPADRYEPPRRRPRPAGRPPVHGHGHPHGGGSGSDGADRRGRILLAVILVPLALATVVGLVALSRVDLDDGGTTRLEFGDGPGRPRLAVGDRIRLARTTGPRPGRPVSRRCR